MCPDRQCNQVLPWHDDIKDNQLFEIRQAQVSCNNEDLKGKTVQVRRGPAAVNGDENHGNHWLQGKGSREGMVSRSIREPENLPDAAKDFSIASGRSPALSRNGRRWHFCERLHGENSFEGTRDFLDKVEDQVKLGAVLEVPRVRSSRTFLFLDNLVRNDERADFQRMEK